jgi:hypothetical protein
MFGTMSVTFFGQVKGAADPREPASAPCKVDSQRSEAL